MNNYIKYYVDSSKTKTINDVLKLNNSFNEKGKRKLNFEISDNVYWFKFSIKNKYDISNVLILELNNEYYQDVQFFLIGADGKVIKKSYAGLNYNKDQIEIVNRKPIFNFRLPQNSSFDIYIRIDSKTKIYNSFKIYSPTVFWSKQNSEKAFIYFLLGIIITVSVFNFVMFMLSNDRPYIILSLLLFVLTLNSYAVSGCMVETFPNLPYFLKIKFVFLSFEVSAILFNLFMQNYLKLRKRKGIEYKIVRTSTILFLLLTFLTLQDISYVLLNSIIMYTFIVYVVLIISILLFTFFRRKKFAVYFLISSLIFTVGCVLFFLRIIGLVEKNIFTDNITIVSSAIFGVILSFGLNVQISNIRKVKARSLQLLLDKKMLAHEIRERKETEKLLKESESKLKEANETKNRFFSIIAHDLKNPFSAIIGFSELLKNNLEKYDIEKTKKFIGLIHKASVNTFKLLENLLEWSRCHTNRMKILPQKISINKIILSNIELFQSQAQQKSIELLFKNEEIIHIFSDWDMTNTVVRNLLSNAIKFTKKGKVEIIIEKENSACKVSVCDTGIGISEKELGKLFQIGETFSQRGTESEKGTGIGLILCKEFIEKNNGRIYAESEKNCGSKFIFTLPLCPN